MDKPKGGKGRDSGWLIPIKAENGGNGGGNPRLVLSELAVNTIVDRIFDGELLKDILEDMGINHRLFWERKNDTPSLAAAIAAAREGSLTYEIENGRTIVASACDRETAAAADVKLKELHVRAQMLARSVFGKDAGKQNTTNISFAAVVVPQKDSPGVPAIGVVIKRDDHIAMPQPSPEALPGAFRLVRKD